MNIIDRDMSDEEDGVLIEDVTMDNAPLNKETNELTRAQIKLKKRIIKEAQPAIKTLNAYLDSLGPKTKKEREEEVLFFLINGVTMRRQKEKKQNLKNALNKMFPNMPDELFSKWEELLK